MKSKKGAYLASSALCLACAADLQAAPQGFEWFPRVPGPGDQLYLIANDPCASTSTQVHGIVLDEMEANFLPLEEDNMDRGFLQIRYQSFLAGCFVPPPIMDVVSIPEEVDGFSVIGFHFDHVQDTQRFEDGVPAETIVNEITWIEIPPRRVGIPPAIAGTWFSPDHAEQGLLININAKRELIVGWTTYGADGKQRWFSGIAPTEMDESTVTVPLIDTGAGTFPGQAPVDTPNTEWGSLTIEYVACGEIEVNWDPKPATGLAPGGATMQQLTRPHDAACDIEAYAADLGKSLMIHTLDIATPTAAAK